MREVKRRYFLFPFATALSLIDLRIRLLLNETARG